MQLSVYLHRHNRMRLIRHRQYRPIRRKLSTLTTTYKTLVLSYRKNPPMAHRQCNHVLRTRTSPLPCHSHRTARKPPARTLEVLRARCPHFMLPHRRPLRQSQRPLHNQSSPTCHRAALLTRTPAALEVAGRFRWPFRASHLPCPVVQRHPSGRRREVT